jgi:hypothetical protein
MHKITVMSKPGCSLCEGVLEGVQRVVGARTAVLIEEVDVTQELGLLEKYGERVPVVLVDGVERFEGEVDPDALARLFYDEPGMGLAGIS